MIIIPIIILGAIAYAALVLYCHSLKKEKYVSLPIWPTICVHVKFSKESIHVKIIEVL